MRLLPDDAGAISITRVLARDMPATELFDLIVAQVGKDRPRIQRLVRGGNLVSGASRYRWEGWELEPEELERLLAAYPDPWPERRFELHRSVIIVIHLGGGGALELPRENLERRRLLHNRSFWDVLARLIGDEEVRYHRYSYREKADVYRWKPSRTGVAALLEASSLLAFSSLAKRLTRSPIAQIDFYTPRS